MDSKVTVIAPPASPDATTTLDFERDDMTSTTINARGNNDLHYTVETVPRSRSSNMQTVIREGDRVLATVRHRDILPDQLILHGSPPISLRKWLKSPVTAILPATFQELGRKYRWKSNNGGKLQLYSDNKACGVIAWFHPSHITFGRDSEDWSMQTACLSLRSDADIIRDTVVVSCILVLQKMRAKDKRKDPSETGSEQIRRSNGSVSPLASN
ncbi:hypothetical protein BJ138DRAFT_1172740 [Hygrophoropsis aurantiaca]|uniref:Uncharacterized protein n=1 Tax=Hygrophoropsis aurantiaca TaxID=72124 RepID=A0ACB8ADC3_9AGAM|nr:hypothetical protein BJ138DRAFT_1172740 [Hygrophoropsis aurantiaca]